MHIITGHLPILPHLRRYVVWKENLHNGEPLDLEVATPLRLAIFSYFTNQKSLAFDREISLPGGYTDRLRFSLDLDGGKGRVGAYYFSHSRVKAINDLVAAFFNQEIVDRVKNNLQFGVTEQDVIYGFIRELGLSEDAFDRLKKACYRFRTQKLGEIPFKIHAKRRESMQEMFN